MLEMCYFIRSLSLMLNKEKLKLISSNKQRQNKNMAQTEGNDSREAFDTSSPLPHHLLIPIAGSHLYRVGLSLYPFGLKLRSKFYNPLLVSIITSLSVIKFAITVYANDSHEIRFYLGDFTDFLGIARLHFNIVCISYFGLALIAQIIHFYHYNRNVSPTYLKPFEMLTGKATPKSLNFESQEDILRFIKVYRIIFAMNNINLSLMLSACFCIGFYPLYFNYSFVEFVMIGVPSVTLLVLSGHYISGINTW